MTESAARSAITIVPFRPELAAEFTRLNQSWIEQLFAMEESDWKVLRDPQHSIIDQGGQIYLALAGAAVIGTAAALRVSEGRYELAKMTVEPAGRGRGIGRTLGEAIITWTRDAGAHTVFLLTNSSLVDAIRLYQRLGFEHRPLPERTGYARADVYMELDLTPRTSTPAAQ